MFENQNEYFL